jgi:hypothetical protein
MVFEKWRRSSDFKIDRESFGEEFYGKFEYQKGGN